MGLIVRSKVLSGDGCKSVLFSDLTGAYDVTLNPGGYNGGGNLPVGSLTDNHIIITLPNSTVVNIHNPVGLPTMTTTFQYTITALVMNGGTKIADGLYQIEYTVSDGNTVWTSGKQYFLITCGVECCVDKLFAKIATLRDCSCDSTIIKNALYASALLKGLLANKDCGNIAGINNLISKLNIICNSTSCGCS